MRHLLQSVLKNIITTGCPAGMLSVLNTVPSFSSISKEGIAGLSVYDFALPAFCAAQSKAGSRQSMINMVYKVFMCTKIRDSGYS